MSLPSPWAVRPNVAVAMVGMPIGVVASRTVQSSMPSRCLVLKYCLNRSRMQTITVVTTPKAMIMMLNLADRSRTGVWHVVSVRFLETVQYKLV